MAAHRYWRAVLIKSSGGSLQLSEFHLLSLTTRVDAGATLTCSTTPLSGVLANLQDDDTDTLIELESGSVLSWDLGVGNDESVTDVRIGAGDLESAFPTWVQVFWSDDGAVWVEDRTLTFAGPLWPGIRTKTTSTHPTAYKFGVTLGNSVTSVLREIELRETVGGASFSSANVGVVASSEGVGSSSRAASTAFDGFTVSGEAWHGAVATTPDLHAVARFSSPRPLAEIALWTNQATFAPRDFYVAGVWGARSVVLNVWSGETSWTNDVPKIFSVDSVPQMLCSGYAIQTLRPTVLTNGGYDHPYSGAHLLDVHRARGNFFFDPAARGRIVGTVKQASDPVNVPLSRRVRLYRDRDGMFIQETWSDEAGNYKFEFIEENEPYTVIAHDFQFNYRAVVADNLTLANGGVELMNA